MRVYVTNHADSSEKLYEGTEAHVEERLLFDFPFLRSDDLADRGDLAAVLERLDATAYYQVSVEDDDPSLSKSDPVDYSAFATRENAADQAGFKPHLSPAFEAARFLSGKSEPVVPIRSVLWEADGDVRAAALKAFGLEVNEANLQAMAGIEGVKWSTSHKTAQRQRVSVHEALHSAEFDEPPPQRSQRVSVHEALHSFEFEQGLSKYDETGAPAPTFSEVPHEDFEAALLKHPNIGSIDSDREYAGKKTYLSSNGQTGYALHSSGELNHVFSLKAGEGAHSVRHALTQGASHLSCFDGKLPEYYKRFGFQEHHREANWTPGGPDVVYMVHPGAAGQAMPPVVKSEPIAPTARSVLAAHSDGEDVAQEVRRAFRDNFVFEILLSGKHSDGTLLARDEETGHAWLLKPGSGGQSSAAGAAEDPSTQPAREAVFYQVAKAWGLYEAFPRAELLIIDGKQYAALEFLGADFKTLGKIEDVHPNAARAIFLPYLTKGTLHQWAALYFTLGETDGHAQNCMVKVNEDNEAKPVTADEDGPVRFLDHGAALAGVDFDPAHDKNSFVPCFLRAWAPKAFNGLDTATKLAYLPTVNEQTDTKLHSWFTSVHAEELEAILHRYGVDPAPSLERFAKIKDLGTEMSLARAINRLWVTT